MSYLAFPAISLFVLVAVAIGTVVRIHQIHSQVQPTLRDDQAVLDALKAWWMRYRWSYWILFAIAGALAFSGATWLLFMFMVGSLGVLLVVLNSLARYGLGGRQWIAQVCMVTLPVLGQLTAFSGLGGGEMHFIDQKIIPVVCFAGMALLAPLSFKPSPEATRWHRSRSAPWIVLGLEVLILTPLCWSFLRPTLQPVTPAQIKHHVESFDTAPFSSSSWDEWQILACWTIDAGLTPNLSAPRRLFEQTSEADPVYVLILGSASHAGLIRADEFARLPDYATHRQSLFKNQSPTRGPVPIFSLEQEEWVIRGSVLNESLTPDERDFLAERLHATMSHHLNNSYGGIKDVLLVTQLLAAIDRPVDPARYRPSIHAMLTKLHSREGGGSQLAGGFQKYPTSRTGSNDTTEEAIELMQLYGVPAGLDVNWVRSFVRPEWNRLGGPWMTAVARERLKGLPGIQSPTWVERLGAERSLIATVVLDLVCLYATWSAPRQA